MLLRALPTLLGAVLATAAPAAAAGPVFVIVPNSGAAPSMSAGRNALSHAKRQQRRIDHALAHAEQLADSAPLLSDRLAAEKAAFQLQTAGGVASGSVGRIEQQLVTLQADANPAPQPVEPVEPSAPQPSFDPLALSQPSNVGVEAVSIALRYVGVPYVWGGASPQSGFDCSGLVQFAYGQLGVALTHYTGTQFSEGMPVPDGQLRPGDLVFFEPGVAGPGHVGIYAGGDEFVEAPHTGAAVRVSSLSLAKQRMGYVGAVRPYGVPGAYGSLGF